ncbi:MAG TPA: methyltransferase domain-containing protein [Pseudobacteroides sp.]|uniref:class I SAM-dependent methyltransferase n=1 Tax=Pseudobacteroides sp. TaxID=1968840 RepID=UPI002F934495
MMKNSTNILKYKRLAPVYDLVFGKILASARIKVFKSIEFKKGSKVLLMGVGTGEDIKYIPKDCMCIGIDISESMLERARKKAGHLNVMFLNMNAEKVDFQDSTFDFVILNLILSVAENPDKVLSEANRILKGNGQIIVFDKFLKKEGKITIIRRLVSKITAFIGTDINREFEVMVSGMQLSIIRDDALMMGGNYRNILLEKSVN